MSASDVAIHAGDRAPLLQLASVSAGYAGLDILRNISLTLHRHEVLAVLGRNGVGKTTLANAIFNLGPSISGDIVFKGERVGGWPTHRIARKGVALVPQGRGTFPNLSVEENLRLATLQRAATRNGTWSLPRIYDAFPRLGERRSSLGSSLSGGERQLLAIARALLTHADLLVLDEPTEGLAPMAVEEVVADNIARLQRDGLTVVLIEQNVPLALRLATRVIVLAGGTIVYDDAPARLAADRELQREHLGV